MGVCGSVCRASSTGTASQRGIWPKARRTLAAGQQNWQVRVDGSLVLCNGLTAACILLKTLFLTK